LTGATIVHRGRTATSFNASAFQRKVEGGDEEEHRQRAEFLLQQREKRDEHQARRGRHHRYVAEIRHQTVTITQYSFRMTLGHNMAFKFCQILH
jgi:hypothetical protein